MVPAAVATHLCLGSVYAWSLFNDPLGLELGVVCKAADDWALGSIVPVFSTILGLQGLSAAIAGTWQERVGARTSGTLGALFFGGGLLVGSYGIASHCLPLLYVGYGVMSGLGLGLSYVPPVATLLRWFPDKRGMATGITIMGFGGGALVAAPVKIKLLQYFSKAPEYLGVESAVELVTEGGRRFAKVAGEMKEVVVATASDVAKLPIELDPGVYVVGTGSTGAAATMGVLGATYLTVCLASSLMYRSPPPNFVPEGYTPPSTGGNRYVPLDRVMRSPQFWLMFSTMACVSTAGMAVVSVAKTMMSEIFGAALPLVVTGAFASSYVGALSAANLAGRVGWASASDYLGRKNTFSLFACASLPAYLLIPYCVENVTSAGGVTPLVLFYGSTMLIFSVFGGNYATMPAYEADVFGAKEVGAIHGRMFLASSLASIVGPLMITTQRRQALEASIVDLVSKADPQQFESKFGAPKESFAELLEAKVLNVASLMEVVPPGTLDPTPFLYNNTMYTAAGLLGVAAITNGLIRPMKPSAFVEDQPSLPSSASQPIRKDQILKAEVLDAELLEVGEVSKDKAKVLK